MIKSELLKRLPKTTEEYVRMYCARKNLKPSNFLINGKVKEL
jgi:hypothetical protein